MFNRVVTFKGAQDIDAGVAFVREKVAPVLNQQHGFRGLTVSVDRSAGLVGVLSLWESEADRDASESVMVKTRAEGHAVIGGTMTVEMFEEMVVDVVEMPKIGSPLLIRQVTMDPARVDENVEFFKSEVLPQIKANPGFCAVRNMIDRKTGTGMVGTIWADTASLETAAAAADARREQAAQHGVELGQQSRREIVFVDMP